MKAVIFDVDGTLIDSVDLHAKAWQAIFMKFGYAVDFEKIRSQIGKGGDQLMPVFLSKEEIENKGKEIEKFRSDLFKREFLHSAKAFPRSISLARFDAHVSAAAAAMSPNCLSCRRPRPYVDVIAQQMPFLYPAFLLLGQISKHLPQVLPQLPIEHRPAALRDEDDMIFAIPLRMG